MAASWYYREEYRQLEKRAAYIKHRETLRSELSISSAYAKPHETRLEKWLYLCLKWLTSD